MPDSPLDVRLDALHRDRRLLDSVISAVALARGESYASAYSALSDAGLELVNSTQPPTLRSALTALGAADAAEGVEANLKLLDQRNGSVEETFDRAKAPELARDPFGRVLLDQGDYAKKPKSVGADGRLLGEAEFEKRLKRAIRVDGKYAGPDGRKAFKFDDEAHLGGGVDLVKTLELAREDQAAGVKAARTARLLDQEIVAAAGKQRELKLLDGQAGELRERRKALEQAPAGDELKLLDAKAERKAARKRLRAGLAARGLSQYEDALLQLDTRVRKRAKRAGLSYEDAAREEKAGAPMPPKDLLRTLDVPPKQAPRLADGNAGLHDAVEQRMRDSGCSYQDALEAILREGA